MSAEELTVKLEMDYNEWNNKKLFINVLTISILVFSLTTLFQSLFDQLSINKVIGGIIALVAGILFLIKPSRKMFLCIGVIIIEFVFTLAITSDFSKEIMDWIFLLTTLLLIATISNNQNLQLFRFCLLKYHRLIAVLIHVECITLLYLLIRKIGYITKWGEGTYFMGFCNTQHTMASLCCLILAMILFYCKNHGKYYLRYGILGLIPLYALFQSGARVFLIPAAVLLYMFAQYGVKKKSYRIMIYIVGMLALLYAFLNSNMFQKFEFAITNPYSTNQLSGFTSGRSSFWQVDMEYYLSGNFIEILFGRCFANIYAINLQKVNMEIWSHNDIIHLLNGTGLVGAYTYLTVMFTALKKVKKEVEKKIHYFMVVVYFALPMLLNGFMINQHFVYSFIILYFTVISAKGRLNEMSFMG